MALRESRRIEYINVLLRVFESTKDQVKAFVSETGLHFELSLDLAGRCYQTATSATKTPAIRTLTHLLPRKTCDPLVKGFKHRIAADSITHTITLPLEILECALKVQARMGVSVLARRLHQLFADLQPVSDPALLAWRCRKMAPYNATYLVDAVRRHAREWGFNGRNLVKAYTAIGVQDPSLTGSKLQLPLLPAAPPMLLSEDVIDEPPELIGSLDHSAAEGSWSWVLPENPTTTCEEEAADDDASHVQPQPGVVVCWHQPENGEVDELLLGSELHASHTSFRDREQLESMRHFNDIAEMLLA